MPNYRTKYQSKTIFKTAKALLAIVGRETAMMQMKLKMETIQDNFSHFIQQVPPRLLSTFVIWLDLKLSEFKVNGVMILDEKLIQKPNWLSDVCEIDSDDSDSERPNNDNSSNISPDFMSDTNKTDSSHDADNIALSPVQQISTENAPFYTLPSPVQCLDTESTSVSKENVRSLSPLDCALDSALAECEKHIEDDDSIIEKSDSSNEMGLLSHKENSPLSNVLTLDQGQGRLLSTCTSTRQNNTESSKTAELVVSKPNCEIIGDNFSVDCAIKEEIFDLAYDLESEQCNETSNGAGLPVPRTIENALDRTSFPFSLNYANLYNGGTDKNSMESSLEETDFQHLHQLYATPSPDEADSEQNVKLENCRLDCAIQQPASRGHNFTNTVLPGTSQEQSMNRPDMSCFSLDGVKSKQGASTDCVLDYSNRNLKIRDNILSLSPGTSHANQLVEKISQQMPTSSQLWRRNMYPFKELSGDNSETVSGDNSHPEMSVNQQILLLNQHRYLKSNQNDVSELSQNSDNQLATNFPMMLLNQGQGSYYNMAANQYGVGALAFNRRLMGSFRTPFKRQAWSQAEKAAVYKFLGGFIREMKIPGKSPIERAQKLCPLLQARTWKNIKYQIYNIICSQKRKQQRRFLATLAVPERQPVYVKQSPSLYESSKMELS